MQSQILLAVISEERQHVYQEFLDREQVSCRIVPSLREMVTQAAKFPHCGILLDMPVIVKASHYDKTLAEDTLRALPSARINIAKKNNGILILPIGASDGSSQTASEFIRNCCSKPSKIVYVRNRIPLHLNVLLARTSDMSDAVQTACIDFSEGGCFLFTTDTEFLLQSLVWIRLIGLEDQTPILGTICWKQLWGSADKVPGIGIRFDVLTGRQKSEILTLIAKKREA